MNNDYENREYYARSYSNYEYNNSYSKYSDISIESSDSDDEINLLETNKKREYGCMTFLYEIWRWFKKHRP